MLTTAKLTVGGIDVKAICGLSSKSPVIYGTTTDGVFADFIESEPSKGSTAIRQLTSVEASIFHKMIILGYHPFESLQAVLDFKKPGRGRFKDLHDVESWLEDIRTSKAEEQEREYWTALMRNSTVIQFNGMTEDPFSHPLWEDRDDPAYYWN